MRASSDPTGPDVGKDIEALRKPKGGETDRPSRERGSKARTRGEVSRTCISETTCGRRTPRTFWTSTPRRRVKLEQREGRRPNRSRRGMYPKTQLARISSWRKDVKGKN